MHMWAITCNSATKYKEPRPPWRHHTSLTLPKLDYDLRKYQNLYSLVTAPTAVCALAASVPNPVLSLARSASAGLPMETARRPPGHLAIYTSFLMSGGPQGLGLGGQRLYLFILPLIVTPVRNKLQNSPAELSRSLLEVLLDPCYILVGL